MWTDDVCAADSTPAECARYRETARSSAPTNLRLGPSTSGRCAVSVCTLHGLPVGYALTGAKADERAAFAGHPLDRPTRTPPGPGLPQIGTGCASCADVPGQALGSSSPD